MSQAILINNWNLHVCLHMCHQRRARQGDRHITTDPRQKSVYIPRPRREGGLHDLWFRLLDQPTVHVYGAMADGEYDEEEEEEKEEKKETVEDFGLLALH